MTTQATNNDNITIVTHEAVTEVEQIEPYQPPPLRPLTRKETAYIKHLHDNPTASKRDAVKAVYDISPTANVDNVADKMIAKIEKRPSVLAILNEHATRAEQLLTEVLEYSADYGRGGGKDGASYAGVAEKTANSILDRLHGKATQQLDVTVQAVTLNIDLTQE